MLTKRVGVRRTPVVWAVLGTLGGLLVGLPDRPAAEAADAAEAGAAERPSPTAEWTDPCGMAGDKRVVSCFSDPRTSPDESAEIVQGLGSLTAQAKAGDKVRISMYHWRDGAWTEKLAEEVAAAKERGADVKVIVDEDSVTDGTTEFKPVKTLQQAKVPMVVCDDTDTDGRAVPAPRAREDNCLMVDDPDYYPDTSELPMNHVKLFLFELGGTPIVAAGSSNMTSWDYEKAWNDFVRVRGDAKLHSYLTGYFDRLWADDWDGWTDDAARDGEGDPANADVAADLPEAAYVYPRKGADPIADNLEKVTACSEDGDGDGDADNRIWVAISGWNKDQRTAILDHLVRLKGAGCDVRVLVSDGVNADWVRTIRSKLGAEGSDQGAVRVVCRLHHKDVLIDAEYDGAYREAVITGSNVWAKGSLLYSAELSFRVGGDETKSDDGVVRTFFDRHQDVHDYAPQDAC